MNVKGLVIKEAAQGENNKIITVLTKEQGVIVATARGVKKITSKNSPGVQLFSYSEFNLNKSHGWYYVREATPVHIFYGLRENLVSLSLASYFCQVIYECIMEGQKNNEVLRLVLNIFYYLEKNLRSPALLKSIFEFRFLSATGMMPDILICPRCGEYLPEKPVFLVDEGCFYCNNCLNKIKYNPANAIEINKTVLHTIRYIVLVDMEKLFNFKLGKEQEKILGTVSEKYLQYRLGRTFSALEFYHRIKSN